MSKRIMTDEIGPRVWRVIVTDPACTVSWESYTADPDRLEALQQQAHEVAASHLLPELRAALLDLGTDFGDDGSCWCQDWTLGIPRDDPDRHDQCCEQARAALARYDATMGTEQPSRPELAEGPVLPGRSDSEGSGGEGS